jgi:hypothetical protein
MNGTFLKIGANAPLSFSRGRHINRLLTRLNVSNKGAASQTENAVMMKALDAALSALQQVRVKPYSCKANDCHILLSKQV